MCDTAYPKSPVQMTNYNNFGCELLLRRHMKEQELREKLRIANKLKHERLDAQKELEDWMSFEKAEEKRCDEEVRVVFAGNRAENGENDRFGSPLPTIEILHYAVQERVTSEYHRKSIRPEVERRRDHWNRESSRYSENGRRHYEEFEIRFQSRDSSHQGRKRDSGFRTTPEGRRRQGNDWKYNSIRMDNRRETYRRI
ncbi:hypothetical protein CRE_02839 [Caenorhabditis remanei]|uniref:Uncharacterized protein n=2 Tax=Caenorhabditis remanei TaxID=31234 RepID=E3LW55_CAERE|nr:hypothetical protein CRE_02839 [Caenorhabditis remanei]